MIIVKLQGGLGNQMFQYAAGRALATRLKTELKLDTSYYDTDKKRVFELGHFNIQALPGSKEETGRLNRKNILSKFLNYLSGHRKEKSMFEHPYSFDQNFFNLPDNTYLEGFFQNKKYFDSIKEILRKEFSFVHPLRPDIEPMASINKTNSVSIHIRRGDYVLPKYKKIFYECPPKYFYDAVSIIESKITDPHFFVFSDNIEWAKTLALPKNTTYVSGCYNLKNFQELAAISLCKHNIIANSTFSWWGAWLNQNPDKIVIAPKKWSLYQTAGNSLNLPTWITI